MTVSRESLTFTAALDAFEAVLKGRPGMALRLGHDEAVFLENGQVYSTTVNDAGELDMENAGCISPVVWDLDSAELFAGSVNSPVFVDLPQKHYRLLQEGRKPQEFTNPAEAGEAWHRALTLDTSEMQYRQSDGQWKMMAMVGFDGHRLYKEMPFDNKPGAAEFVAAYTSAAGPNYQSSSWDDDGIGF